MSEQRMEEGVGRSVVTWRALLAGSVGVVLIGICAPYINYVLRAATLALDFSVPAAVFMMFVLAALVNLVRLLTRRSMLNRSEMLVAYSMMAVATAVVTMGLVGYLVPMLGSPEYYKSAENRWETFLMPHIPSWIMLSTEGAGRDAIRYMYEGLPAEISRAELVGMVRAWASPLAYWSIFLGALYATSISLMALFRKQWVEDERIVFPLAQLPMELASEPSEPGERLSPFLKSPLLWIGVAIPFVFVSLKALPGYVPYLTGIAPTDTWRMFFLEEQWQLDIRISWQTIGLAYLLSADVALCVWVFGFLGSFYHGVSSFAGFTSPQQLGIYGAGPWPDLAHFGMGAMIALVFLRLYIGRRHLKVILRKAVGMGTDFDDRHEPMSYCAAFWITVAGFVVMTVWLMASGFSLPIALLVLFGAFVGFVGLTRIIAESGMPVSIVPLISSDFVVSAVGSSAIGREGLAALPWTYVWNGDVRTIVMVSAAHGMRVCSERKRNYRGLFFAMLFAVALGVLVAVVSTLYLAYQDGGGNLAGWFFVRGPVIPFDHARGLIEGLDDPTSHAFRPSVRGWTATGIGITAMVLFTLARHHFVWWPLNPVGLPISVVIWTRYLWFPVFLAWLIKSRFLKYGGPKLYLKMRPLFLGLVLGQYVGAVFWAGIAYLTGVRGVSTFWI